MYLPTRKMQKTQGTNRVSKVASKTWAKIKVLLTTANPGMERRNTDQSPRAQVSSSRVRPMDIVFFKKNGPIPASFVYFRSYLVTISLQIEKSVVGVLGIRTRGRRMEGADETTELWRPPKS